MSVTVTADPAFAAGHAVVRVAGAADAVGSPGFRIRREEDWENDKLGLAGWQSSDALLMPDRAEASGADLVLHVGWAVCRHLEAGVYTVEVPAGGQAAAAAFWPDIPPMHAGEVDVMTRPVAPALLPPIVQPAVAAPAVSAVVATVSRPSVVVPDAGPPPGVPRLGLVAPALLLLLLVSGGAGYYVWMQKRGEVTTEVRLAPAPAVVSTPDGLSALAVPDVLARAPNAAAITAEGNRRLLGDRRDDGLLLLEAAADRGDGGASAALARLYDPVLYQPAGPIPKPDPRQAARYYREAARAGMDVSAAREALRHSLEGRAQSGDLGAKLSLKDFWP